MKWEKKNEKREGGEGERGGREEDKDGEKKGR